jgi:hypothetical protein
VTAALWAAALLAVIGGVGWLNLVLLPRLAYRLHVPHLALAIVCLPVLAGVGWLLGGTGGAITGGVGWCLAIGVPRILGWRVRSRLRKPGDLARPRVIEGGFRRIE